MSPTAHNASKLGLQEIATFLRLESLDKLTLLDREEPELRGLAHIVLFVELAFGISNYPLFNQFWSREPRQSPHSR